MKVRPTTPTQPAAAAKPAPRRNVPLAMALGQAKISVNGIGKFPTSYITPMVNRIKVSGAVASAIVALGQRGINVIHIMQISELALAEVFATPDLPGLVRGQKTGAKAISTYALSAFVKQRTWQVEGEADLLKEIRITSAVKAELERWDQATRGKKTLNLKSQISKEELERVFSSKRLEGADLEETHDIFIGFDQGELSAAAPEPTANTVFAAQLAGPRENFPQTMAARVKAAFGKPLDGLLADAETLCGPIGSIETDKDKKPAREACKGRLRQGQNNPEAIVSQLEDSAAGAEKILPLLKLFAHLGVLRVTEELLKYAESQDKFTLYINLCLQARLATKGLQIPKEVAYFWYLEGFFNEELGANEEARACYEYAAGLDPKTKAYTQGIARLARKEVEKEVEVLREFKTLWEKAVAEAKTSIKGVEHLIMSSATSGNPDLAASALADFTSKKGDGGKLFDEINKDCFAAAQKLKKQLLPQPEAAQTLAAWLNQKPLGISRKVLEEIASSLSESTQKPSGYALLFALAPKIEDDSLREFCETLKDEVLNDFIRRMSLARRFGFVEGFMLCIAIEDEGVIFPDQKAVLDQLLDTPQRAYGPEGQVAYMFAHRIYHQLYSEPATRIIQAAQRGDVASVEKEIEGIAEAAPEGGEADKLRVLNYCIAAEVFAGNDNLALSEQYIKKAQAIDPESRHVDRALAVYNRHKENYPLAVEFIEKAVAKTPVEDIYPVANTAIQIYIHIADDHQPEPSLRRAVELAIIVHKHKPNNTHNCYLAAVIYNTLDEQENFLLWIRNFMTALRNCKSEEDLGMAEATGQSDRESLIELLREKEATAEITQLIGELEAFTS